MGSSGATVFSGGSHSAPSWLIKSLGPVLSLFDSVQFAALCLNLLQLKHLILLGVLCEGHASAGG